LAAEILTQFDVVSLSVPGAGLHQMSLVSERFPKSP